MPKTQDLAAAMAKLREQLAEAEAVRVAPTLPRCLLACKAALPVPPRFPRFPDRSPPDLAVNVALPCRRARTGKESGDCAGGAGKDRVSPSSRRSCICLAGRPPALPCELGPAHGQEVERIRSPATLPRPARGWSPSQCQARDGLSGNSHCKAGCLEQGARRVGRESRSGPPAGRARGGAARGSPACCMMPRISILPASCFS